MPLNKYRDEAGDFMMPSMRSDREISILSEGAQPMSVKMKLIHPRTEKLLMSSAFLMLTLVCAGCAQSTARIVGTWYLIDAPNPAVQAPGFIIRSDNTFFATDDLHNPQADAVSGVVINDNGNFALRITESKFQSDPPGEIMPVEILADNRLKIGGKQWVLLEGQP